MAITWPQSLPQTPLRDGFSVQEQANLIRSPTETGPGKTRPRQTHVPENVQLAIVCSTAQKATLQAFRRDDLAFGAIRFEWPALDAHVNGQANTYQFMSPPKFAPFGVDWKAQMELQAW